MNRSEYTPLQKIIAYVSKLLLRLWSAFGAKRNKYKMRGH